MPTLRLGDIVPDFTADTTEGEIRFHDWLQGSWAIFFRYLLLSYNTTKMDQFIVNLLALAQFFKHKLT
jgi:hypothetical protein